MQKIKILILVLFVAWAGLFVYQNHKDSLKAAQDAAATAKLKVAQAAAKGLASHCASNTADHSVVVSIIKQHMWACSGSKTVYDSAVITGMQRYANELTPPGTYKVYGKLTDQTLTGSDQFGSWRDPVSYWMPFLSNQYGVYGFHDAAWRANSDFGKINVNAPFTTTAKSGSHGCVELPLAAAKWLYGWATIGTTVTINS